VDEKLIGRRLREVRQHRGLTQAEVSEQLGVDQTVVSNYERGAARVHGALIAAFATVLRTSADEILGLKAPKKDGVAPDRRLLRRLEEIEKLPRSEKQALLKTIDRFVGGSRRAKTD
jgi:transcriptional regulator with XRE-family HTH domain